MDINKIRVNVPLPINIPTSTIIPNLQEKNNNEQYLNEEVPHKEPNLPPADIN